MYTREATLPARGLLPSRRGRYSLASRRNFERSLGLAGRPALAHRVGSLIAPSARLMQLQNDRFPLKKGFSSPDPTQKFNIRGSNSSVARVPAPRASPASAWRPFPPPARVAP